MRGVVFVVFGVGVLGCSMSRSGGPDGGDVGLSADGAVFDALVLDAPVLDVRVDDAGESFVDASSGDARVASGCFEGEVVVYRGPGGRLTSFPQAVVGRDSGWIVVHAGLEGERITFVSTEGVVLGDEMIHHDGHETRHAIGADDDVLLFTSTGVRRVRVTSSSVESVYDHREIGTFVPTTVRRYHDAWRLVRVTEDDELYLVELRLDASSEDGLDVRQAPLDEVSVMPDALWIRVADGMRIIPHRNSDHLTVWWHELESGEWRLLDVQLGSLDPEESVPARVASDHRRLHFELDLADYDPETGQLIATGYGGTAFGFPNLDGDAVRLTYNAHRFARRVEENDFAWSGYSSLNVFGESMTLRSDVSLSQPNAVVGASPAGYAAAMVLDTTDEATILLRCTE